jgi:hypothetical protein
MQLLEYDTTRRRRLISIPAQGTGAANLHFTVARQQKTAAFESALNVIGVAIKVSFALCGLGTSDGRGLNPPAKKAAGKCLDKHHHVLVKVRAERPSADWRCAGAAR